MALNISTRSMNHGKKTNGKRKRVAAHSFNQPKTVSVLGVLEVSNTLNTRKATVYMGAKSGGYVLSKSTRGLEPFSSNGALESALKLAEAEIRAMEKPFAQLAQLPAA